MYMDNPRINTLFCDDAIIRRRAEHHPQSIFSRPRDRKGAELGITTHCIVSAAAYALREAAAQSKGSLCTGLVAEGRVDHEVLHILWWCADWTDGYNNGNGKWDAWADGRGRVDLE